MIKNILVSALSAVLLLLNTGFSQTGNDSVKNLSTGDVVTNPKSTVEKGSTPKIDGKINDSEWQDAKVFTDFYMMIPKSDSKDNDSTIAYIKQTKDAIYIAIKYWPR